jgi:hypothetical protein
MFIDASPSISAEKVQSALEELMSLLKSTCGGLYHMEIADKKQTVINFE